VVEALKAIDDPSDAVAVVAALKSISSASRTASSSTRRGRRSFRGTGDRPGVVSALPGRAALRPSPQRAARRASPPRFRSVRVAADVRGRRERAVVNPVQASRTWSDPLLRARSRPRGLSFREAVARLVRRTQDDAPEPGAFTRRNRRGAPDDAPPAKGPSSTSSYSRTLGLREAKPRRKLRRLERAGGRFGVRLGLGGGTVGSARLSEVEAEEKVRLEAELRRLLYVASPARRRRWSSRGSGDER